MEGWIKLHRNILNWSHANSSDHLAVFVVLLLRATHKKSTWRNITLQPGQLVTGRKQLSTWTGLSEARIRSVIRSLRDGNEIDQQITSKFSIITITNWEKYQQDNQQITSKQPASNQQVTTFKNAKNVKNEKKNTFSKKILSEDETQDHQNIGLFEVESPSLEEVSDLGELEVKILTALNAICYRSFRPTKNTLKPIRARLSEGYQYEDFVAVIKHFNNKWANDPQFSGYLQPSTLFNTKFDERVESSKIALKPKLDPLDAFFEEFAPRIQEGA